MRCGRENFVNVLKGNKNYRLQANPKNLFCPQSMGTFMRNLLLKIKKCSVFFLLVSSAILFAGCSSKPLEGDGKKAIQNQINQDAQGRIILVKFHKTNGQLAEINAVKVYNLEFGAEIEFTEDCKWLNSNTGQGYSFRTSKLVGPDAQSKTYGFSWNQFADAGLNPGMSVQKAQRMQVSGAIRFEKKENGWVTDEIELNSATPINTIEQKSDDNLNTPSEVLPTAPTNYFNDYANVVSPATASRLNSTLEDYDQQNSNQIVVAVFPKMRSSTPIKDYTSRIANFWNVGQKDNSNGVALFIFIQDRKMYMQVGIGLQKVLPDTLCKQILDTKLTPQLKKGDFDDGLTAGVAAIIAATKGTYQ